MKIAFLSQMGFTGKIARNHPNMRTEFAQMCALNVDHYPLASVYNINTQYDHAILLIPKTASDREWLHNVDIVSETKKIAKISGGSNSQVIIYRNMLDIPKAKRNISSFTKRTEETKKLLI